MEIKLIIGGMTKQKADAIVNAANATLLGGGGISGAIHRAAGRELEKECRSLGWAEVGEARITKGYNLPSKYVIHAVGPVYHDGESNEDKLLEGCYINSLLLAKEYNLKSIIFPAISTGIHRYPKHEAAKISLKTIGGFIEKELDIQVTFIFSTEQDLDIYRELLNQKI